MEAIIGSARESILRGALLLVLLTILLVLVIYV